MQRTKRVFHACSLILNYGMFGIPLSDAASIAQIFLAVIGTAGLISSLLVAILTIREVRKDRVLRHRPYLAFEQGGFKVSVDFVSAGKSIPGVNPGYVAKVLPNLPAEALSVRPITRTSEGFGIGKLTNFGVGPALHTSVTWIAQEVTIGSDSFRIDERKLAEPVYSKELNTMPSFRAHIAPNSTTFLTRLPTFIEKDVERKIRCVEGVLEINCDDIFHTKISIRQQFCIYTDYGDQTPGISITFGHLLPPEPDKPKADPIGHY